MNSAERSKAELESGFLFNQVNHELVLKKNHSQAFGLLSFTLKLSFVIISFDHL